MIYYRSKLHRLPLVSPLQLAYSDVVLQRGKNNPWPYTSPPGQRYEESWDRAFSMLHKSTLPAALPNPTHATTFAYCSVCGLSTSLIWVCESCGCSLCDKCESPHACT